MAFDGGNRTVSGAEDVFFSGLAANQYFGYDTGTSKWINTGLTGKVALATGGGSETVSTNATATGAVTLNLTNGNVFNVTTTGNVTFTFSGATSGRACSFALYLRQDGTGNRTVTWPGSVRWSGGAPTRTATASAIDIFVFESIDGGSNWFGSLVGANFS